MILETERLILRPVVQDDHETIYKYASNPNIGPHAGWKPHDDLEETQKIMDELWLNNDINWAITVKGDNSFRGVIGFLDDPRRNNPKSLMIGYWINESDWGKGYTTEAARTLVRYGFEELKMDLLTISCYTFNERSRRVIEKMNMNHEGTLRQVEIRFDGVPLDQHVFSMTKEEFEGLKDKGVY